MKQINHTIIREFFLMKLQESGLSIDHSIHVTEALINASLFGIDSHGVRLFSHYLDCLKNGRVKTSSAKLIKSNGLTVVDAKHSFSHSAAQLLLAELDQDTLESAVSAGCILNSDHYGASGIHAFNSQIEGKIILSFTNADALANSPDGKSVIFGTNPISCVFREKEHLLYIDLATTKFSMNRVKNYRLENKELPPDVGRNSDGHLTRNAFDTVSLEPIGGHKGFALAFLVEILTSGLTGMKTSFDLMSMYGTDTSKTRGVSHSFIVINPSFFPGGLGSILALIDGVRSKMEHEQLNLSPGIKEMNTKKSRMDKGIPVDISILDEWKQIGFGC